MLSFFHCYAFVFCNNTKVDNAFFSWLFSNKKKKKDFHVKL